MAFLGLRSYFTGLEENECEEGAKEANYHTSYPDVVKAVGESESSWCGIV